MVDIGWIGCHESSICDEGDFEDVIMDFGSVTSAIASGSQCY